MDRAVIPPLQAMEVHSGTRAVGRSDVGRSRAENQDFMGLFRVPGRLLAVVADGMGGASGGYEASRIAVDAMRIAFTRDATTAPIEVLENSIRLAHEKIREVVATAPELDGMGTTIVAVLVADGQAWFGHVGDSRAYVVRDGVGALVTLDHSRVNRMLIERMIKAEQVANHPMGHILERSVGAAATVDPEVTQQPVALRRGDRIVLCSDGVWSVVDDADLTALTSAGALPLAAESTLGVALARGTDDNATVLVVEVAEGPTAAPAVADVRARHGLVALTPSSTKVAVRASPTPTAAATDLRIIGGALVAGLFLGGLGVGLATYVSSSDDATPSTGESAGGKPSVRRPDDERRDDGKAEAPAPKPSPAKAAAGSASGGASGKPQLPPSGTPKPTATPPPADAPAGAPAPEQPPAPPTGQ